MNLLKTRVQQVDTELFIWCQKKFCRRSFYPIVRAVSASGDGWLYAVIACGMLTTNSAIGFEFFMACLFGFSLEVPIYIFLKNKFKRNRPADTLQGFIAKIKPSDKFSFPSGHTAAAFVMLVQIGIFCPSFALLASIWACAIGISRIALGVHFPGDILAGALVGTLCGFIAYGLAV
ncbi:phosphatase PAP2 family protein [Aliikangiella sp. G2MR2-5]|uniref:phosphatase PAP2 family protein n=1 Tax=Aliikangiella sp. G2MR2-5 TaxID=2788943 RepID=UPI0018AC8169|nr:phosphatase PAP2 family protein [Aliikangiella sp. G2MR2-5]